MRLRKKANINEKIRAFDDIVLTAEKNISEYKGHWRDIFNGIGEEKLFVELGTGKGDFISQLAELNTKKFFIGLEVEPTVLYSAARKIRDKKLINIRLAVFDINNISEIFADNEIDRLYINFCDPWPKKRHAKRRLTHINFIEKYRNILKSNGEIFFKTDNRDLFDFSLEQFTLANVKVTEVTYDLHADNPTDNIETEYEKKFSSLGVPICRCVAKFE